MKTAATCNPHHKQVSVHYLYLVLARFLTTYDGHIHKGNIIIVNMSAILGLKKPNASSDCSCCIMGCSGCPTVAAGSIYIYIGIILEKPLCCET